MSHKIRTVTIVEIIEVMIIRLTALFVILSVLLLHTLEISPEYGQRRLFSI